MRLHKCKALLCAMAMGTTLLGACLSSSADTIWKKIQATFRRELIKQVETVTRQYFMLHQRILAIM